MTGRMKPTGLLFHALGVIAALFVLAVLPVITHFDVFGRSGASDAVSGATIELPDRPSGEYVVIINAQRHPDTIGDWKSFFSDDDFPVIFEDISCLAAAGDVNGIRLAERFRLQLPENQMLLRTENADLLASKTEAGCIDVAIFSAEMAEHVGLEVKDERLTAIKVSGGEE